MNKKRLSALAIIFVLHAIAFLIYGIFVNDKVIPLVILFALSSSIIASQARKDNPDSESKSLTEKEKQRLKIFNWVALILLVSGVVSGLTFFLLS